MGSRARKKYKKAEPLRRIAEWQDLDPCEMHRRSQAKVELSILKKIRRSVYRRGPLHSVRGIRKPRRHCSWGGWNGAICMCCLRRSISNEYVGKKKISVPWSSEMVEVDHYKCSHCGSSSIVGVHSMARLPRRTAGRKKWRDFFQDQCKYSIERQLGAWPDDFMANA